MDTFRALRTEVRWVVLPAFCQASTGLRNAQAVAAAHTPRLLTPTSKARLTRGRRDRTYPPIIEPKPFRLTPESQEELKRAVHKRSGRTGTAKCLCFTNYDSLIAFTVLVELYESGHFTLLLDAVFEKPLTSFDLLGICTLPANRKSGIRYAIEKTIAMLTTGDMRARLRPAETSELDFAYYPVLQIRDYMPRKQGSLIVDDVPWHELARVGTRHEDIAEGNQALVGPYKKNNYTIRDDVLVIDAQSLLMVSQKPHLEDVQIQHSVRTALHLKRLLREHYAGRSAVNEQTLAHTMKEIKEAYELPDSFSGSFTYKETFPKILERFRVIDAIKAVLPRLSENSSTLSAWPNVAASGIVPEDHKVLARSLFQKEGGEWVSIRMAPIASGKSGASTYLVDTFTSHHETGRPFIVKINTEDAGRREEKNHRRIQQLEVRAPRLLVADSMLISTGPALHGMCFEFAGAESGTTLKSLSEHVLEQLHEVSPNRATNTDRSNSRTLQLTEILDEVFRSIDRIYAPRLARERRWDNFKLLGSAQDKLDTIRRDDPRISEEYFLVELKKLGTPVNVVNPVKRMERLRQKGRGIGAGFSATWSIIHGDLHPGNILVTPQGTAWIVDFYNYGEGHFYRDFTRLEAELRGRYMRYSQSEAEILLGLEEIAAANGDFYFHTGSAREGIPRRVRESLLCGQSIRRNCLRVLQQEQSAVGFNQTEYLFSLFSNALAVAARDDVGDHAFEFLMAWCGYLGAAAEEYVDSHGTK